ncbi:MAG: stress response translation initiation inhibitor YciH [Chloroflexi bacterium]|nr:stress response translation initiation inhibitor YciH [Chloroflexota bacterium]
MRRTKKRPVYSTDSARAKRCPRCGTFPCRCPKPKSLSPERQVAYIRRESKGRRGKTVTVICNLQLTPTDMADLCKRLKKACGTGGTVKEGVIEIQGHQRERVAAELEKLGYRTKLAGG